MTEPIPPAAPLPEFEVRLDPPDIGDWIPGNTGIPGVTSFDSGQPGPHVAVTALMHGNEYAGAIVLDRLLRAGIRPARGRLSLGFLNVEAFTRFDPRRPTVSRFIDEDMNRVWDERLLDCSRRSLELDRARELRPWIDTVDVLLDLHSMLWPSDPVILCGGPAKGRDLAMRVGGPGVVVSDRGHDNGRRLIDYTRFSDPATAPAGILVEAGEHWDPATVEVAWRSVSGLLDQYARAPAGHAGPSVGQAAFARVTHAITATTSQFAFVRAFRGGEVLPLRNTLIALDGEQEIRTPYDRCLLVLPSLRPGRGHTAVRLARFEDATATGNC
jgi:hypothetical protein